MSICVHKNNSNNYLNNYSLNLIQKIINHKYLRIRIKNKSTQLNQL